ncbi:dihydrofolate reductase [Gleimia hominis]|uniref:dihydrofolate reductase n=1 Tax=Gleimia hominis TaxID=595468 RepID=A0ABU3IBR3_9ACTO|nr:dihydrofolate reductase [Gleimia hominis]MDT3767791.1 dihydrofolate reductase [Gleimia hominis]
MLRMIWAQDRHRFLGTGRAMAWHVPADFAHFKRETMGSTLIMGRRSWEALGRKNLPGRESVVITSQRDYVAAPAYLAHSLPQAIEVAQGLGRPVWITGGAQVYEQGMEFADELVVTDLDLEVAHTEGVYAPTVDLDVWRADPQRSDSQWRAQSGDARWKVTTFVRRAPLPSGH